MLHDVKVRTYDRIRKSETHEVITVDAAGGDDAAEAALALRPGGMVVGVAPTGGLNPVGGTLEGDDNPVVDDEDREPGPSNRELAMMAPRRPSLTAAIAGKLGNLADSVDKVVDSIDAPKREDLGDLHVSALDVIGPPPAKRGPGRPRKEPQS